MRTEVLAPAIDLSFFFSRNWILKSPDVRYVWSAVKRHRQEAQASGQFEARRRAQSVAWMHELIEDRLRGLIWLFPGSYGSQSAEFVDFVSSPHSHSIAAQ